MSTGSAVFAIPWREYPIDDMPALKARLSTAKLCRIRYFSSVTYPRPKPVRPLHNPIQGYMQRQVPFMGSEVDDIVEGIARLDHHGRTGGTSIPLSVTQLYNILQCLDPLSTEEIRYLLGVDTRQAQKYLKAAKLCIKFIVQHQQNNKSWNAGFG